MSAWLLLGRRIRAQDLQVRWELDRETASLCRYKHGYNTTIRKHGEILDIKYSKAGTHILPFLLLMLLNFYSITYMTRVNANI